MRVYLSNDYDYGIPSSEYQAIVVREAKDVSLSNSYIPILEDWTEGTYILLSMNDLKDFLVGHSSSTQEVLLLTALDYLLKWSGFGQSVVPWVNSGRGA